MKCSVPGIKFFLFSFFPFPFILLLNGIDVSGKYCLQHSLHPTVIQLFKCWPSTNEKSFDYFMYLYSANNFTHHFACIYILRYIHINPCTQKSYDRRSISNICAHINIRANLDMKNMTYLHVFGV